MSDQTTCDVCGRPNATDADFDCPCDPECASCKSKCWTDHSPMERMQFLRSTVARLEGERDELRESGCVAESELGRAVRYVDGEGVEDVMEALRKAANDSITHETTARLLDEARAEAAALRLHQAELGKRRWEDAIEIDVAQRRASAMHRRAQEAERLLGLAMRVGGAEVEALRVRVRELYVSRDRCITDGNAVVEAARVLAVGADIAGATPVAPFDIVLDSPKDIERLRAALAAYDGQSPGDSGNAADS